MSSVELQAEVGIIRGTSCPLWKVDRIAFEAVLSGDSRADAERRVVQARTLLPIMTVFEYEMFRDEVSA
jgi:hypothetical protein